MYKCFELCLNANLFDPNMIKYIVNYIENPANSEVQIIEKFIQLSICPCVIILLSFTYTCTSVRAGMMNSKFNSYFLTKIWISILGQSDVFGDRRRGCIANQNTTISRYMYEVFQ